MSQVHPQEENQEQYHPHSHDQSDAQDQLQIDDQLQAIVRHNHQGSCKSHLDFDVGGFTCFSKLPLELQRNIWEIAAVPQPRVIEIETICGRDAEGKTHPNDDNDEVADNALLHWSPTQCSPTPLLGIRRESRSIAMKYYK